MVALIPLDELAIVGGNLALDFANTQSGPAGGDPDVDALDGYADLVAWAARAGAIDAGEAAALTHEAVRHRSAAEASFARALDLRATLYAVFSAVARGEAPPVDALDRLRAAEAEAIAGGRLAAAGDGFAWSWAATGDLARPLWPVAHAATTLLTGGPLARVKGCGGCRFLFVDETKNGSRRWCRMEDCGTRAKSRRFVARRSAARSARA